LSTNATNKIIGSTYDAEVDTAAVRQHHLVQPTCLLTKLPVASYSPGVGVRTFTVHGGRNGSQVFVTWTDGEISGDPPTVDLVHVEVELAALNPGDCHSWRQVGGYGELPDNPLRDPDMAWRLIASVLDTVTKAEGDLPPAARDASRGARQAH
jgi:hypothetical protein